MKLFGDKKPKITFLASGEIDKFKDMPFKDRDKKLEKLNKYVHKLKLPSV